jgi:hypothetical protein
MFMSDTLTLDAPRRTKEGFLAVRAKAARSGVYDYLGAEVDPEGAKFKATDIVKVYRPETEVFDKASIGSFFAKPITDNHPSQAVTKDNWRQHARGAVMGALRDGEHLAFDLALMDAAAIDAVDSGKRELSNGYSCDLSIEDGTAPDGTAYQAVQRNIRGNHIAIVDRGRAGPECRIRDAAICDSLPTLSQLFQDSGERTVKKLIIDGLQVDLSDAAATEVAITKLQGQLADSNKALTDATTAHDKALAAKDAEIDDLKGKVVDQATIDARADEKAEVVAKAKAIVGDKLGETAGKTPADIRRTVVQIRCGDAAVTDKSDDYVAARFDALKDGASDSRTPNALDTAIKHTPASIADGAAVRDLARAAQY